MRQKWLVAPAAGHELEAGAFAVCLAIARSRLRYGGHDGVSVVAVSDDEFAVELRPIAKLTGERVLRRLRSPGAVRFIPLASSYTEWNAPALGDARQVWIRVAPGGLIGWDIREGGLVIERANNGTTMKVMGYDSTHLITNMGIDAVAVEATDFPNLSRLAFSLNKRGVAAWERYPSLYRSVPERSSWNVHTGFAVDGWLISTAAYEGMALPSHLCFQIPVPPPDAEDVAAAISFPWPDHTVTMIEADNELSSEGGATGADSSEADHGRDESDRSI